MLGLLSQGTVEGNNVALLKQFVQRYIGDAGVRCREFVVCYHVHPETLADINEDTANLAGAHYAHGLAVEVKAGEAVQ